MHELACPQCSTPSQYDFRDYILMCPFCSASFMFEIQTGHKETFGDHYIVPNTLDAKAVKELSYEWLKRLHHSPASAESEFYITDIKGSSVPFWVVSLEGHTAWKGLVSRRFKNRLETHPGADFLIEQGQFRRSYRWAVSARENLCEGWGMTRLHEPAEDIDVEWDGFPLDSTLSRGRIYETKENDKSAYDIREYFDFKFANGLPILGVQINEQEALRRAEMHVNFYHFKLAKLNVDYLVDARTELEIAGVQLLHLPFWHAKYVYKPRTALRHFYKPREKNALVDGYGKSVLKGELAIIHRDKILVNALVCGIATLLFLILGGIWHPTFFLVAIFAAAVGIVSAFVATARRKERTAEENLIHGGLRPALSGALAGDPKK